MRIISWVLIAVGLASSVSRGDDAARKVIDEAIRAHGGEAALAKWPVVTIRTEGIFHGYDRTPVFFFTCETINAGPDRWRVVLDGKMMGETFRITNVFDRDRGWVRQEGKEKAETREFTADELAERREAVHLSWVSTLLPLKDPAFTLTRAGQEEVSGRPADGVRVAHKGYRDITLFFDKETHLLVKTETPGKGGTPAMGKVETIYRLHKDFQGIQRPTMMMVKHNDRFLMSHWVLDYRLAEKPEGNPFGKP